MNDSELLNQLFNAGCYWGHQQRYRNPKMKQFIWGKHNNIDIIDLNKALPKLKLALAAVEKIVENGGKIVLVGTKQFASDYVSHYASKVSMPFVNRRWLGGTLTNFKTVKQSVKKLVYLESMIENNKFAHLTKKERLMQERKHRDLTANLGGLRDLHSLPDAIIVLDAKHDRIAVLEANKLGIPVIAILDTNSSDEGIKYGIPGNDDSMKSIELYLQLFTASIEKGLANVAPEKKISLAKPKAKKPAKKDDESKPAKRVVTVKREEKPKAEAKKVVTVKKAAEAKKVVTVKKTAEAKKTTKKTETGAKNDS